MPAQSIRRLARKHGYWTNDAFPSEPGEWLEEAERHEGSWWTEWASWLGGHSGREVKARPVNEGRCRFWKRHPDLTHGFAASLM